MSLRYTPENITSLDRDEIFVFGSNLQGLHHGVQPASHMNGSEQ